MPLFISHYYRLLFVPIGNNIRSYSVATGIPLVTFIGHTSYITGINFHPIYTHQLITTSLDGTIRIWDQDDGTCIKVILINSPITRLASALAPNQIGMNKIYIVTSIFNNSNDDIDDNEEKPEIEDTKSSQKDNKKRTNKKRKVEENETIEPSTTTITSSSTSAPSNSSLSYPLGDEPACLQVRPPFYSLIHTLNINGKRRTVPLSTVLEVDIGTGDITQTILQRKGFVTGLEIRRIIDPSTTVSTSSASTASNSNNNNTSNNYQRINNLHNVAVLITVRHSLYIYRSIATPEKIQPYLTIYKNNRLISTLSIHPIENYVSVGTLNGHIVTYFIPELTYNYIPTNIPSNTDSTAPLIPILGNTNVRRTEVHWHAHTPWATNYVSDGTFLLSGGEESTLVVWQVPPATARGTGGPSKDKRTMTFVPRLGAPIRCISSYSAAGQNSSFGTKGPSILFNETNPVANAEAHGIKDIPPLIYAVTLVDNTVIVLNGLTLKALWRISGLAIAGQAAILPVGLTYFNEKVLLKNNEKLLQNAVEENNSGAILRAQFPISKLFRPTIIPSLYYANSRYLRKGFVVDPRTKCIYMNGFPGRASLQLYDIRKDTCVFEIDVGTRNLISRTDDEPSPPVRVTHAAVAYDGSSLVTVEVTTHGEDNSETNTLKFWSWVPREGRYALSTRIDNVHKTEITTLEYHPTEHYVITGSRDRTFKHWQREVRTVAHASEAGKSLTNDTKDGSNMDIVNESGTSNNAESNNPETTQKLNRKEKRAMARSGTTAPAVAIPTVPLPPEMTVVEEPVYNWTCLSVGFYRDFPVTAGAFSGDGSLLALAYSHIITLWTPMANSLKRTLVSYNTEPITNIYFIGFSEYIVCTTANSLTVWNLLTCTIAWSYQASIVSLTADRVGLSTSNRFAVIIRSTTNNKHYCLLFDVASPTPLQIWDLVSSSYCHAGTGIDEEQNSNNSTSLISNYGITSSSYSITFIPASSLPLTTTNTKSKDNISFNNPNGLFILGPMNEVFTLATINPTNNTKLDNSTLLSTMIPASNTNIDKDIEIISLPLTNNAATEDTVGSNKKSNTNQSGTSLIVTPTVSSSVLRSTAANNALSNNNVTTSNDKSSSSSLLSSSSNIVNNSTVPYTGSLTSMVASFGPTSIVQQPTHVFETLLSSFLAPPVLKIDPKVTSITNNTMETTLTSLTTPTAMSNFTTSSKDNNDWSVELSDFVPLSQSIINSNTNTNNNRLPNKGSKSISSLLPSISSSLVNLFSSGPSSSNSMTKNPTPTKNNNIVIDTEEKLPTSNTTTINAGISEPTTTSSNNSTTLGKRVTRNSIRK